MRTPSRRPDGSSIWYTLWTASKLLAVLLICIPIAILMLNSTQPTTTPEAPSTATPRGPVGTPTPGPTPTSLPTPVRPQDVVVAGHLFFVKGRVIYDLHQYDDPRVVTVGAQPAISPDGHRLAYVVFTKNYTNLYTYDRRTGKSALLLDNKPTDPIDPRTGSTAADPAWSNDSTSIFFSYSNPGALDPATNSYDVGPTDLSITRCPAAGPCTQAGAHQLSRPLFQTGGDENAAPRPADPHTLVYTSYHYQTSNGTPRSLGQLAAIDLTTEARLGNLSPDTASVLQPAWNPHGRYIAFVKRSPDGQQSSIWVMAYHPSALTTQGYDRTDFDRARMLIKGAPFAEHPVFSPDGRYLAYSASGDDGHFHLFMARVHLGRGSFATDVHQVRRVGIIDSDTLAWSR